MALNIWNFRKHLHNRSAISIEDSSFPCCANLHFVTLREDFFSSPNNPQFSTIDIISSSHRKRRQAKKSSKYSHFRLYLLSDNWQVTPFSDILKLRSMFMTFQVSFLFFFTLNMRKSVSRLPILFTQVISWVVQ